MTNLAQTLLVPLVAVVGLIVLIALGKISADVGIPVITALAGVHIGSTLGGNSSSSSTTTSTKVPTV